MIYQCSFYTACYFVNKHHRHLKAPIGHKFSLAFIEKEETIAVIIAGRPVNRNFDNSFIEFSRICSKKYHKNLLSQLLAAARKKAKSLGYKHAITYIREDERGSSLKADNWELQAIVKGRQWKGRKQHEIINKKRFYHKL